jgi:hypothetical protein
MNFEKQTLVVLIVGATLLFAYACFWLAFTLVRLVAAATS